MSVKPDQHAIIHELKFDLCFIQVATGNCSWQLATCPINRPIRALVDFSCNYFLVLYLLLLSLYYCRMMKATAWFCPLLLTLLSATRLVCTAQRGVALGGGGTAAGAGAGGVAGAAVGAGAGGVGYANGYPLDYLDAQVIQVRILYTVKMPLLPFPLSRPFAVWQQMSHIFVTVFRARIFIGHFRFL